jgi:excisionase family DNA binding protein
MEEIMEKRLLTVKELAHYIGLAPQTIKNRFYAGMFPIPAVRIGRKLLWDRHDVDKYLNKLPKIDG